MLAPFALRHSPRPQRRCRDDAAHLRRLFGTANIAVELFGARPQPCVLRPAPQNYHHPNWRPPKSAKQFAAIKRKSNCPGNVFLDTPRARSAFFVSTARALSGAMAPFIPFVERGTNLDVGPSLFQRIRFECRGTSFFILGRDSLGRTPHVPDPSSWPASADLVCVGLRDESQHWHRSLPGSSVLPASLRFPLHLFSPIHDLFHQSRSAFGGSFDEAGWIAIPGVPNLASIALL